MERLGRVSLQHPCREKAFSQPGKAWAWKAMSMKGCCFSVCRLVTSFQYEEHFPTNQHQQKNSAPFCSWCTVETGELLPPQHSPPGIRLHVNEDAFSWVASPHLSSLSSLLGIELPWISSILGGCGSIRAQHQCSEGPHLGTLQPLQSWWGAPLSGLTVPLLCR